MDLGCPRYGFTRHQNPDEVITTLEVLLAVIEETARHAGHAEVTRGQIDGQTGR